MTKREMMASFDDVVTDRRIRHAEVERVLAATGETPRLLEGEYVCLASGGSSGLRGVFVWHWEDLGDYVMSLLRAGIASAAGRGGRPDRRARAGRDRRRGFRRARDACHHRARRGKPRRLAGDSGHSPDSRHRRAAQRAAAGDARRPTPRCSRSSRASRRRAGSRSRPRRSRGPARSFRADRRAEIARIFGCPVRNTFGSSERLNGVSPPTTTPSSSPATSRSSSSSTSSDRPVTPASPRPRSSSPCSTTAPSR